MKDQVGEQLHRGQDGGEEAPPEDSDGSEHPEDEVQPLVHEVGDSLKHNCELEDDDVDEVGEEEDVMEDDQYMDGEDEDEEEEYDEDDGDSDCGMMLLDGQNISLRVDEPPARGTNHQGEPLELSIHSL